MRPSRVLIAATLVFLLEAVSPAGADDRLTRVPPPQPAAPRVEAPAVAPARPAGGPAIQPPAVDRPSLLEPAVEFASLGRGALASFHVVAADAVAWQLVVSEVDGPVAQVFTGEGEPPVRVGWDGCLADGGLAWSGLTYTYDLAYVDSTGTQSMVPGAEFTLPPYTREEPRGVTFLMLGSQLQSAARSALAPVAARIDREPPRRSVCIEVLASDADQALALGREVRATLTALCEKADRPVDLLVGAAAAAPADGTVKITTVPAVVARAD